MSGCLRARSLLTMKMTLKASPNTLGSCPIVDYLASVIERVHATLSWRLVDTLRFEWVFLSSDRHLIPPFPSHLCALAHAITMNGSRMNHCWAASAGQRNELSVGWRGGTAPPRSRQTGRESLPSSGFLLAAALCWLIPIARLASPSQPVRLGPLLQSHYKTFIAPTP